MSSAPGAPDFVVTTEHQRFTEFCDACRRYRYIGLCYGPPGVGKTLSARHYAHWHQVEAYVANTFASVTELAEIVRRQTIFYTAKVVNSPRGIEQDVRQWRHRMRLIHSAHRAWEAERHPHAPGQQKQGRRPPVFPDTVVGNGHSSQEQTGTAAPFSKVVIADAQRPTKIPDPTSLLMIDEADRLKPATLEQVRDIFDRDGLGVVFIGMPGLEKRLSRYPQLYSRVGFVHAFRPLSPEAMRHLLQHQWMPPGVILPEDGLTDEEALAAIMRMTGGNFRLLHRLLTQIARLVEINGLRHVTREVVEAAREMLVIGAV